MKPLLPLPATLAAMRAAGPAGAPHLPPAAGGPVPQPIRRPALPPLLRPALRAHAAPENDKARGQAGFEEQQGKNKHVKHSAKSTASEAQRQRALAMLANGPKNTIELRAAGIFQTSTRIKELREQGHNIITEKIVAVDADGYTRAGIARYHLVGKSGSAQ